MCEYSLASVIVLYIAYITSLESCFTLTSKNSGILICFATSIPSCVSICRFKSVLFATKATIHSLFMYFAASSITLCTTLKESALTVRSRKSSTLKHRTSLLTTLRVYNISVTFPVDISPVLLCPTALT